MALDMNIYTNSDENVTTNEFLVTNDSIVGNYNLLANGSIAILINGVNWTNIPGYVSSHEYGWSHSGISRRTVIRMFKKADLWRFYGKNALGETKELAYWIEDFMGNIYYRYIQPAMFNNIDTKVGNLENETSGNITKLNASLSSVKKEQEIQDTKSRNLYHLVYRWTSLNEEGIKKNRENISKVALEASGNRESINSLESRTAQLEQRVNYLQGELGRTRAILESLIVGALAIVLLITLYKLWKQTTDKLEEVVERSGV